MKVIKAAPPVVNCILLRVFISPQVTGTE